MVWTGLSQSAEGLNLKKRNSASRDLWTSAVAIPWASIMPAYFEFLDLPDLHDHMSQSLKINRGGVREGVEERSVTSFTFTVRGGKKNVTHTPWPATSSLSLLSLNLDRFCQPSSI